MKQDLATSVFAAVIGVLVAYFVCNMFLSDPEDVTFSTLSESESFALVTPDPEIFNVRSVNPTVEVYVGNCENLGENNTCNDEIVTEGGDNTSNTIPEVTPEPTPEVENENEEDEENKQEENPEEGGESDNGSTD